ncbi:E3 ubiquitin-protein ligase RNF13 isoform X2 [Anopheles coustani]|uniref:E3 ubiquitin-protein ligase RNF13 isoform X2 n=1 Tax=Anopheles coustani TaxID=139045 RepID=UPI00265AD6B4|nr:E3 ubiquitin-protein ligase RNF13 isoform X2 [Anopheles coustani]
MTGQRLPPRSGFVHYQAFVLLATIMLMLHHAPAARADILVYQMLNDQIIEEFRDLPGTFGGEIPDTGMKVLADWADPPDGCTEFHRKPPNNSSKYAVVIARYNCSFEVKVRNAQQAGYALAIIHNVGSNDLEHMSASHPQDLIIPSVFVGESSGRSIIEAYTYDHDFALVITDDIPFNISNNLIIPFAIVVGLCFIIMVLFMIIRCIRERRRTLRNRLPARMLKRIGIVKFAKGMQYDTCAICLDDFVENERLRVLPCRHAYHAQCIDPWLTKNRRVCPICKRKVIVRGERLQPRRRWPSDSMSSSDPDETTPLLNSTNESNQQAAGVTPPATSSSSQAQNGPTNADNSSSAGVIQTSPRRTAHDQLPQHQQQLQQNSTPTSHVVNVLPSDDDDELLDDRNVPNARWLGRGRPGPEQQQEPMNESPYSPIGDEATLSRWQRFKRLFTRTTVENDADEDIDPEPPSNQPQTTPASATTAATGPALIGNSNNILNVHLAGSFHGSEDTTDDELLGAMSRDVAKRRQFRSAPDMPSTSTVASSAGAPRVGVAALPNENFNPTVQIPDYLHRITLPAGPGNGGPARTGGSSRGQPRRSRNRGRPHNGGGGDGSHIV